MAAEFTRTWTEKWRKCISRSIWAVDGGIRWISERILAAGQAPNLGRSSRVTIVSIEWQRSIRGHRWKGWT